MLSATFSRTTITRRCTNCAGARYFNTSSVRRDSQHSGSSDSSKQFTKTLLLPATPFPLWNEPSKVQARYQERTGKELYHWQWKHRSGKPFVLHDGPPYANGDLHMGHALNKILKDIINRFHVLSGRRIHYVPGWDCHGLPIENKALQELGKDSMSVLPDNIRKAAQAVALREIASQKSQFRQLGIMADWDTESTYRTLDHHYQIHQLRIFQTMVKRGLIYRNYYPVHYSPSSRSALAEAELVYKDDHVSHSVYVTYTLDGNNLGRPGQSPIIQSILESGKSVKLLVWTTTPWTLPANMGIAVNPELPYVLYRNHEHNDSVYIVVKDRLDSIIEFLGEGDILAELQGLDLVGLRYNPMFSSQAAGTSTPIEILPGTHVTAESGTGLVHCAPAHGGEDYNLFRDLGLLSSGDTLRNFVDANGCFTEKVAEIVGPAAARDLVGEDVLGNGSKAVVNLTKDLGCLVKIKRIKHRYPYDWKTDKPIIVLATSQWFVNLPEVKQRALAALDKISFFPPASRNRMESFVKSRSEWCLSRQRVWGVPIPALIDSDGDATLDSDSLEHIISVLEQKGIDHWWNGPIEDFIPKAANGSSPSSWVRCSDTMDVWFDSGVSWSLLPRMGAETEQPERGTVADLCLEGSDQHRGWFQSQLWTSVSTVPPEDGYGNPYHKLITHGMVLDQNGKKMSKSLGNIISPLTVINGNKNSKDPAYGADVLRLWAATVEYWRDMSVGPTVLSQAAESLRKVRNTARFILGNIGVTERQGRAIKRVARDEMGLAERYVMHELYSLEISAFQAYSDYEFPKVINGLTTFANVTLSSLYFDITKDCLYADHVDSPERRAVVTVLEQILNVMVSVLAPVLPYLAEEIHESRTNGDSSASVFANEWKKLSPEWEDQQAASDMRELLRVRNVVLSLLEKARGDKRIKSALEAEVDIVLPESQMGDNQLVQLLQREESFLKTLFIVSDASITEEGSLGTSSPEWMYMDTLPIPGSDEDLVIRVRPATLEKCPRCWTFTRPENDTLCRRCTAVVGS